MSRSTISTGSFTLQAAADKKLSGQREPFLFSPRGNDCRIVLLADFSGRSHRGLNDSSTIRHRKILEVDRDNFDDVFAQMEVRCALPIADEVRFSELDDMHPDFLYEQLEVFNRFRSLKKKLQNPATFESAAAEIYGWQDDLKRSSYNPGQDNADAAVSDCSLLDSVLAGADISSERSFDLQSLVKDIVAPYVMPKPDPKLPDLLQSVDQAASELMRKLMHHPHFQALESAWRSLYLLVRRIETDNKLKLFIVDISQQELMDDALSSESYRQTQLYHLLVETQATVSGKPFNVIMVDATFGSMEDDIATLSQLGKLSLASDALLLTGGNVQLAGCEDLSKTPDRDDWRFTQTDTIKSAWKMLRESEQAANIIAVAPRYLTRLPYGKKSAPIDSFHFEELPSGVRHAYYLWSNGAWLLTLHLAQGFLMTGDLTKQVVQEIERLPLHVYTEDDESLVTPCAEVNMLDAAASALKQSGLTVIRSVLNKDAVMIPEIITLVL